MGKKEQIEVKKVEVKKEGEWTHIFSTVIEKKGGEHVVASIEQNDLTKEIRVIEKPYR